MNLSLIQLVTSRSKWAKIALLAQEQLAMAWYSIRRACKILPATLQLSDSSVHGAAQTVQSEHQQWNYSSRLSMPSKVLKGAGTRYRQDQVLPDGTFAVDYDYQSAVFHEASIYSNGTSHVSAFDRHGKRLDAFSSAKYSWGIPKRCRLEPQRYLVGTTLSLYGNVENTGGNAGHWMVDGISRAFLALSHRGMDDIDHVLVPCLKYGFQLESLLALGFKREKIIEIDTLQCVRCERLILTTPPRGFSSCSTPGWLIDSFRQALLPAPALSGAGKRLYISRRDAGSRKFVDEEAIISCLEGYGFETIEMSKYSYAEKIALFANAEMIVGLHGAGLTNVMFCQRDTMVLELFPESYVTYFYTSMCSYIGVCYHPLVFRNRSWLSNVNMFYGELFLEPQVLAVKLDELLGKTCQRISLQGRAV